MRLPLTVLCLAVGMVPGGVSAQEAYAGNDLLRSVGWLAGCWEAASDNGHNAAEEQWMEPRGGLMVGMSRSIRGGVATGYELATIRVDEQGLLVFHAEPSGQEPADFPARSVEAGRLEFVNAAHDFPQKIVYVLMDKDFLHVAVFGEADAADPAFLIPYRRVACAGR